MAKLQLIKGQRFGKLTFLKEGERIVLPSGQTNRMGICICDCGRTKNIRYSHLVRLRTTSKRDRGLRQVDRKL